MNDSSATEYFLTLTAASVSANIFCDLSRSFFNCEVSAISEARNLRFSTYKVDICAFSSSMRTLRVELSLDTYKPASCTLDIRTYLVICLLARRNFFLTTPRLAMRAQFKFSPKHTHKSRIRREYRLCECLLAPATVFYSSSSTSTEGVVRRCGRCGQDHHCWRQTCSAGHVRPVRFARPCSGRGRGP